MCYPRYYWIPEKSTTNVSNGWSHQDLTTAMPNGLMLYDLIKTVTCLQQSTGNAAKLLLDITFWNGSVLIVYHCFRHTLFVQEYEVLGPHEDILLLLRGGPADLEVGLVYRHNQ